MINVNKLNMIFDGIQKKIILIKKNLLDIIGMSFLSLFL